jgi:hypothetical protein
MASARSFADAKRNIDALAGKQSNGAGCVSRTRMFRVTRAALYLVQPSRRKLTNGQRRRSAKRMRPCNRDYRSERNAAPLANSGRSRCQTTKHRVSLRMSFSENRSPLFRDMRLRMSFSGMRFRSPKRCVSAPQVESTETSRASSRHAMRVTIRHPRARASKCGRIEPAQISLRTRACGETLNLVSYFGPSGPSCLFRRRALACRRLVRFS